MYFIPGGQVTPYLLVLGALNDPKNVVLPMFRGGGSIREFSAKHSTLSPRAFGGDPDPYQ